MGNLLKIGGPVPCGAALKIGKKEFELTAPSGPQKHWNLWLEGGLNNPRTGYTWLPAERTPLQ